MRLFLVSIHHGFSGLACFSGRESRPRFWAYAAFVAALLFVLTIAIMLPPISHAGPDRGVGNGLPSVRGIIQPIVFIALLAIGLLAGAVVRRLHDVGRSAAWALLPLPFLALGLTLTPAVFESFTSSTGPEMPIFLALLVNNLLYLLSLGLLLAFLVRPGSSDSNRYGPPPRT